MPRFTATALALLLTGAASAAEFSSVEERMSQAQFHAAGLDKLSPAELKALNDWLRGHETTKVVTQTGEPIFYPKDTKPTAVDSRIDGAFAGWYGRTVFKLENGQEWVQTESGSFSNGKYDHPKVRVKPMMAGDWLMYVEPCGCSVRVARTK